ncbi:MAG: ferritin-like domain-containing protein [Pegethrix bostrychoides GSE-TBD4-15B]|jgi:rubrerythrin|uniref:Ferritin-like domain-containing protein n=1 Tax=Pegethrix bostrychoides GSE-TBD4-15B TaxID=2839662 RepID=A0A951PF63_9CYAN|nr:ferritin-like domain-containing protein [Pegethrix bostrychoides GSE-TBD4-15B]
MIKRFSRRGILASGGAAGLVGAVGLAMTASPSSASSRSAQVNDAKILNGALYYEHQAIWAYQFAAGKLSNTEVGQAVLALAKRNLADHMAHRDVLASAVESLGGMPVAAESSYDLSSYIEQGEGNIDSDVNIAKLALALETDAAIAYISEVSQLKTPALISAGASIGSTESAHATAIRAAFVSLGVEIDYVPASFVSADTRPDWVLKV